MEREYRRMFLPPGINANTERDHRSIDLPHTRLSQDTRTELEIGQIARDESDRAPRKENARKFVHTDSYEGKMILAPWSNNLPMCPALGILKPIFPSPKTFV